jgi:hypothetical protein
MTMETAGLFIRSPKAFTGESITQTNEFRLALQQITD